MPNLPATIRHVLTTVGSHTVLPWEDYRNIEPLLRLLLAMLERDAAQYGTWTARSEADCRVKVALSEAERELGVK